MAIVVHCGPHLDVDDGMRLPLAPPPSNHLGRDWLSAPSATCQNIFAGRPLLLFSNSLWAQFIVGKFGHLPSCPLLRIL